MTALPRYARATNLLAVLLPAFILTLLTACVNKDSDFEWPADPSPTPNMQGGASDSNSLEADAVAEISNLIEGYQTVELNSFADPQLPHVARPKLAVYLADPQLSRTLSTLQGMYEGGIAFVGRPVWTPLEIEVNLSANPPTGIVRNCVNAEHWRSVFVETGDPVPGDMRMDQYVMSYRVKLFDEGWLVVESDIEEGAPC